MFLSKKFVFLFLASLIGFTLSFSFCQRTLAENPPVIQPQNIAGIHKAAPISRRAEGNTS